MGNLLYLSYLLDGNTPTYGNRNTFVCAKKSDISKGDVANDSSIETTVHIGTHIDMPYHFFENGQTIEDFDIRYFHYSEILFIEITSDELIIKDELILKLKKISDKEKYELLIVKTSLCNYRHEDIYWRENYGFDPMIAHYLRAEFSNIRVIAFDSISVSSFTNRLLGREAHKAFLNPDAPILLLEDVDLRDVNKNTVFKRVDIVPLRIAQCDGLPCTIIAEVE